jgi:hypothetical protein
MKINPYFIYKVLSYIPYRLQLIIDFYINICWHYCHYKYGSFRELHGSKGVLVNMSVTEVLKNAWYSAKNKE